MTGVQTCALPISEVLDRLLAFGYRGQFICGRSLRPIEEFSLPVHQPVREGRFWDAPDYCNNFLFAAPAA